MDRRRFLLPHLGSATGHLIAPGDHHTLQHIQVHFGVNFQADFEDVWWYDGALTWNHTKDHYRSQKLCFHHPAHVPVIRNNPDLHFEGTGNGPVVITWIGRQHELYSGASPISPVEHCVTFRHDRRLLSLLGFVHNWPTSRWSATKNENRFSLNGNGIMSSFLGRQFYHSIRYIYKYIYVHIQVCIYLNICIKHIYIYISTYMGICMYICVYIYTHVLICLHICIYTSLYIYIYIYIYINVYIYVYLYICIFYTYICMYILFVCFSGMAIIWFYSISTIHSSSSSCRAASMDNSDPLSPLLPIIHRL